MQLRTWRAGLSVAALLAVAAAMLRGCDDVAVVTRPDASVPGEMAGRMGAAARAPAPGPAKGQATSGAPVFAATPATPESAQTRSAPRCGMEYQRRLAGIRDGLRPTGSPREALLHALLSDLVPAREDASDASSRRFHAASERWPTDIDLAWGSAIRCGADSGCDPRHALRRLAALDGGNANVWMLHMRQAQQDDDPAALAHALRRAATAAYYDSRSGSTYLAVRPAFEDPAQDLCIDPQWQDEWVKAMGRMPTPADLADLQAMGMEHAQWMPTYTALAHCRTTSPAASVRRDCLALLEKVAAGDTLLDREIALSSLIRLLPQGPQQAAARERYRQVLWLSEMGSPATMQAGFVPRRIADGEIVALQDFLRAQGRWPAPEGWLPENGTARALITTGRRPDDAP